MRIGIRVAAAGRDGEVRIHGAAVSADGVLRPLTARDGRLGEEPGYVASTWSQSLGKMLRDAQRYDGGEGIDAVVFDVTEVLTQRDQRPIVIRIAPRAPVDDAHALHSAFGAAAPAMVIDLPGGHTTLGQELVELKTVSLRRMLPTIGPGRSYVITAVGALADPSHENRVADLLYEIASPSSVEVSHQFYGTAFDMRERTSLHNLALRDGAENLSVALGLALEELLPNATPFVTQNDGGVVPLARLSSGPVHSLYSDAAIAMIGAAALAHVLEGDVIACVNGEVRRAMIVSGVPTAASFGEKFEGVRLATQTARLVPFHADAGEAAGFSADALVRDVEGRVEVEHAGVGDRAEVDAFAGDLVAIGAACAPLAAWENRIITIRDAGDSRGALSDAEAQVKGELLAYGAVPEAIRILESRVVTTAYENSRIASVRVRGIAVTSPEIRTIA